MIKIINILAINKMKARKVIVEVKVCGLAINRAFKYFKYIPLSLIQTSQVLSSQQRQGSHLPDSARTKDKVLV